MRRLPARLAAAGASLGVLLAFGGPSSAGVVNPNISVVGQPLARWTDNAADADPRRVRLSAGETEFVFDAYLNPYATGTFVASLSGRTVDLEEGYFSLVRGLPAGLALKGGKYRVGFGHLNPQHPHAWPFAEPFGVLTACLPGGDSFNETGVDLSRRFPIVGDFSIDASVDYLQGDSFRRRDAPDPDSAATRPGVLGRLSGFAMLGEQSAIEFGVTGTRGTNNVAAGTRTTVLGGDVKAKLWNGPGSYVVVQSELLWSRRETASAAAGAPYTRTTVEPGGGYVYADYNWSLRYNAGASCERFREGRPGNPWTQSVGAFAGLALMEETTAFRLDWRRVMSDAGRSYNTVNLRVVYSMGPHKAHQF